MIKKLIIISAVLSLAWFAYLKIVPVEQIGTKYTLIMIWCSVVVLFLGMMPGLLNRVTKIKIYDFEIELEKTVNNFSLNQYVSLPNENEVIFAQKGNFRQLKNIINESNRYPKKPVLLTINLSENISLPILFTYVFFLNLLNRSVALIFIKAGYDEKLPNIKCSKIVGAISGRRFIGCLLKLFPKYLEIISARTEFSGFDLLNRIESHHIFQDYYSKISDAQPEDSKYLIKQNLIKWFGKKLSFKKIQNVINNDNLMIIQNALKRKDEYLFVLKEDLLHSVVYLPSLFQGISKNIIADLTKEHSREASQNN